MTGCGYRARRPRGPFRPSRFGRAHRVPTGSWWPLRHGPRYKSACTRIDTQDLKLMDTPWDPIMFLPCHWAASDLRRNLADRPVTVDRLHDQTELQIIPPQTAVTLSSLPNELLIDTLGPLIPTARTFHFSPTCAPTLGKGLFTSVHQFRLGFDDSPDVNIAQLALTCRRIRVVVYSIFYGENRFILEVAPRSLNCLVRTRGGSRSWRSWNRVCPSISLSATTMRYLTSLTICVCVVQKARTRQKKILIDQLNTIALCFNNENHELKRLTLCFGVPRNNRGRCASQFLEIYSNGVEGTGIRIRSKAGRALRGDLGRELAAPLLQMRGIKDVEVVGSLNINVAEELKRGLLQRDREEERADKCDSIPPEKRTRLE